ncbi:MAG TPA: ABC transporter ATP-binding protein [Drouetiella sp.]
MLQVRNVSKSFSSDRSVAAVSDISLEVKKGEFLAVVGRSGSGKSTLLGMLGGINKPSAGTISIDAIDQWKLSDDEHSDFRNQKIGFVFQFASLLPTLRAIDNVALPALVGGTLDYKNAYERAQSLLRHVGLSERAYSFPNQMSGGEQRRVAIARALINSPSVILADEPTADLDQETEEEILDLLVDIHRAFDLTMVVVTHSATIAERADQVLKMSKGSVESIQKSNATHAPKSTGGRAGRTSEIADRTGESADGTGENTVGTGENTVGTGENTVGKGESTGGTGENTVGKGESTGGTGESTGGTGGSTGGTVESTGGTVESTGDTGGSTGDTGGSTGGKVELGVAEKNQIEAQRRIDDIFKTKDGVSVEEAIRLGDGVERLIGKFVLLIVPIILVMWGISSGIQMYQQQLLDAKENQRIEMEDLAMKGLRADVRDVVNGPGKSYIVTLYFINTTGGEKPVYIMAPSVRGFVQVGTNWQEVPMKPASEDMPKVLKITGDQTYKYIIEPDVSSFTQLLPYYMHVRIGNDMLISPSDQPKADLIERNDNYYVYLKPHGADDAKILQKMKFPGKPPVWIPMPPH